MQYSSSISWSPVVNSLSSCDLIMSLIGLEWTMVCFRFLFAANCTVDHPAGACDLLPRIGSMLGLTIPDWLPCLSYTVLLFTQNELMDRYHEAAITQLPSLSDSLYASIQQGAGSQFIITEPAYFSLPYTVCILWMKNKVVAPWMRSMALNESKRIYPISGLYLISFSSTYYY